MSQVLKGELFSIDVYKRRADGTLYISETVDVIAVDAAAALDLVMKNYYGVSYYIHP
jgi:hypothetical protein